MDTQILQQYRITAHDLIEQANRVPETLTNETYAKAGDLVRMIANSLKRMDEARKSLVKPLNDHVKFINSEFKTTAEPLTYATNSIRNKMGAWAAEQERLHEIELANTLKKAEDEALKRAAQYEADGKKDKADNILNEIINSPAPTVHVAPAYGDYGSTTSIRKTMDFEITNLMALPHFLMAIIIENDKAMQAIKTALRKAVMEEINNGRTDIPGINLVEKRTVQVR